MLHLGGILFPHRNTVVSNRSQDSVVGIATRLWVGRSGPPIPSRGKILLLSKTLRPGLGPAQPLFQWL